MHSLTSALDGGEWSASCPGHATPKERALSTHWIGGFDQTLKELEQADGHTFQMTNQPTQPNPTQPKPRNYMEQSPSGAFLMPPLRMHLPLLLSK